MDDGRPPKEMVFTPSYFIISVKIGQEELQAPSVMIKMGGTRGAQVMPAETLMTITTAVLEMAAEEELLSESELPYWGRPPKEMVFTPSYFIISVKIGQEELQAPSVMIYGPHNVLGAKMTAANSLNLDLISNEEKPIHGFDRRRWSSHLRISSSR
jgi:hypothetical protein